MRELSDRREPQQFPDQAIPAPAIKPGLSSSGGWGTGGDGDPLDAACPTPVTGRMVEVVEPTGYPEKARIPCPIFRAAMYRAFGYAFVMIGLEITGLG